MRYILLATDYDGTLASHGQVAETSIAALKRVRASGRKLALVTGRHLPDLRSVFPHLDLFDRVVAENGALLYRPESGEEKLLCEPPNPQFIELLSQRTVPISVGRGIVATWEPHQESVLKAIRDLGLDLQVIFNKGSVMVLPSGVNKATGLKAALTELGISPHNVVGIGDAENDHAFLAACECSAAVDNALPLLKERADVVTTDRNGAGTVELIEQLLADDLASDEPRLVRHAIALGSRVGDSAQPVRVSPHGSNLLVAGPSSSGKSTAAAGILEQLTEHKYQYCLIDPEGDYENLPGALTLGTAKEPPDEKAVLRALESPEQSVVVNLLAIPVAERPKFFAALLPVIQELRARTARPHWLVIDEAHHMLPASWTPSDDAPRALQTSLLITVHPDHVSPAILKEVDVMLVTGKSPMSSFRSFANAVAASTPSGSDAELQPGEALVWFRRQGTPPIHVRSVLSQADRRRHLRQYADGEMSPQQSFYFRGPESKLNLRAQNLNIFLQLAEGLDDATWMYHLRRGDYSHWFGNFIKDEDLAREAAGIERDQRVSARESRRRIRQAIESRYTAPA